LVIVPKSERRRIAIMQTQVAAGGPRYLFLSPAGMAVALAALAFLRGLFAWPFIVLIHHRMGAMGSGMPGQVPGQMPGQMPGHMYGGHMYDHLLWQTPWALPALWLASIVAAAIAGAIFAVIYNAVAARVGRIQPTV
jgi:hypothetical protein